MPLSLSLRYRRLPAKSEITSVGVSPSSTSAFAIYIAPQTNQSWIDFFDLDTQRGYTKATGAHAVFGPPASSPISPCSSSLSSRIPGGSGGGLASTITSSIARISEKSIANSTSASLAGSAHRVATLRDWTVQLGPNIEYHHSSTVLVRDFATGKTAIELRDAARGPVVWSHDGLAIAAGDASARGRVGVWDVRTGARIGRVVSHIDDVTHAAFTPEMTLVTLSRDGTARVSDPTTGRTLSRLEIEGTTAAAANPRLLAVSRDGRSIVSLWGTTVHVWIPGASHLTSYDLRTVRQTESWPLCVSPDGRWMASRTEDGLEVLDVASGAVAWERREEAACMDNMVTAAAFSGDGSVLVLGRMSGAVEVWDVVEKN
ncbi:hypothetical protein JDV02_000569 [Purpureocillium takamizusanense]|uniref:Uncharacterized protein n=1 Tax=Purpureocillium takamizusanense TaxID=2060973 RepID=A0A9Q8Q7C1_9HYPO|nr:uncharacterized protein JDV02_000569 [Purpureocillium takamizusanense]UNI13874.1 hypothetical protein JDV02_000569 [Purpureocillium takamizusanense]